MRCSVAVVLAAVIAACGAADPAEGQYVANIITVMMPKATVRGLLDTGLDLFGPVPGMPNGTDGMHPVIFCFGQQREVHPTVHIGNLPFNWAYSEFIFAVPFITLGSGDAAKGPYTFAPRLFLDNATHEADAKQAILAGWAYSLSKRHASIATTPADPWGLGEHVETISNLSDPSQKFLSLKADSVGGWETASSFPNFKVIGDAMNNRMIGDTSAAGKDATGKWACEDFHWHLDTARVASLEGVLTVESSWLPALPAPTTTHFAGIAAAEFGAFRLATNWTMSMPGKKC